MDFGISQKVALVAGGGRGIGRACALALAREGAHVAVLSRTRDELERTAQEIRGLGVRAVAVPVDALDAEKLSTAIEQVRGELGLPTLAVLGIAGFWGPRRFHSRPVAESEELLKTDLSSALALCRQLLPSMVERREGRLVALGSMAAWAGIPGGTEYAVAKAGLEGLMRGISVDYAKYGITANVVSLGFVETERLKRRAAEDADAIQRLIRATARRKLLTVEEVADVVTFLCSSRAAAITGAVIDVTAGAHLNNLW
jgi:NAD(P)-dependent dehydrogenase (short-subunit alcohol dehydrogenase family)